AGSNCSSKPDAARFRPSAPPFPTDALTLDNKPFTVVERQGIACGRPHRAEPPPAPTEREIHVSDRTDLLQGTLDLLILKTLVIAPLHGWGISKQLRSLSDHVLQVNQGSLYPALYRLEDR